MNIIKYIKIEKYIAYNKTDELFKYINGYDGLECFSIYSLFYFLEIFEESKKSYDTRFITDSLSTRQLSPYQKNELMFYIDRKNFEYNSHKMVEDLKGKIINSHKATMVHIHVPKAAGTSFNKSVAQHFYRDGIEDIPGNDTIHTLKFFFENALGEIPFLSTGHIPLKYLTENVDSETLKNECILILVKRNKRARLNSMRNQLLCSLLTLNFFNRFWAYRVFIRLTEFFNFSFFPINNKMLIDGENYCLSGDPQEKNIDLYVKEIPLEDLKNHLSREYGINLEHVRKNKTINLSKYLPPIRY